MKRVRNGSHNLSFGGIISIELMLMGKHFVLLVLVSFRIFIFFIIVFLVCVSACFFVLLHFGRFC